LELVQLFSGFLVIKTTKEKKLYNCFVCLGASVFVIVLHAVFHQTPNQDAFGLQMEEV